MCLDIRNLALLAIFASAASMPPGSTRFGKEKVDKACLEEARIRYSELSGYNDLRMGPVYHERIARYNLCIARKLEMVNKDGDLRISSVILPKSHYKVETALRRLWWQCRMLKTPGDPGKTFYDETDCFVSKILRCNPKLIIHTAYTQNLPHNLPESNIHFYVYKNHALS